MKKKKDGEEVEKGDEIRWSRRRNKMKQIRKQMKQKKKKNKKNNKME